MRYVELRKYNSAGTAAAILPNYTTLQASALYNDVGAIDFTYPYDQAVVASLDNTSEVGVVIDGVERERYLIENTSITHATDGTLVKQFQGRSTLAYLEDAIVYPQNWPVTSPAGRAFIGGTAGTIMRTLILQAKTLGYLSMVDETSFTGTLTTDGVAWTKTLDVTYSNGQTLLQSLLDLVTRGICDVKMVGRQLRLYNFGFLAVHRPNVVVRRAFNISEASSSTDSRDFASTVLIEGDLNAMQEVNDAAAVTAVRKRARYVQQGGITDPGTLTLLAQAELDGSKTIKEEVTLGISVQDGTPQPWTDFSTGEWFYVDRASQVEELQCKQISLAVDENRNLTVGLTVKDLLDDTDEKLKRKIDAITGGNSGTYGPLPNPNGPDLLAPNPPASVSLTPNSYQDSNGRTFAQVTISWPAVTTNTDSSALDDLEGYDVEYWLTTSTNWQSAGRISASPQYVSQLPPGASFQARVRAIDTNGNPSTWTLSSIISLPNDTVAPPQPTTPTVATYLGQLRVTWDGFAVGPAAMPADFDYIEVHISTTTGFVPSSATKIATIRAAGAVVITDLLYNTTYFIKFIARDRSGNASPASAQASGVPQQVVQTDVGTGQISFDQLAFKDADNLIPDGSFEIPSMRALRLAGGYAGNWASLGGTFGNTLANRYLGETYMQWATNGTQQLIYLTPVVVAANLGEEIPCTAGDQFWARFAARSTGAIAGVATTQLNCRVRYIDNTTTAHVICPALINLTSTWVTSSGQFTVPANGSSIVFYAETNSLSSGNILTDAYEVRRIVGTALIQDAAITNAKIANLAVNDAKIANLAVGKLTAGNLTADVTVSARIATALAGARVELNSTGLHAFNGSGTETVTIGSDGSAYIQGQLDGGSLRMPSFFSVVPGRTSIDSSAFAITVDGTTNVVKNPSFENFSGGIPVGVTNGPSSTAATSRGPVIADYAGNLDNMVKVGKRCMKITCSVAGGYAELANINLAPSTRYRLSFYCSFGMANETSVAPFEAGYANFQNVQVIEVGGLGRVLAQSLTAGHTTEGSGKGLAITFTPGSSSPQALGALTWTNRWEKDFTTPADLVAGGAVKLRLPAYVTSVGGVDTTKALFYDAVQIEAKPYLTMYCDGDQDECTWAGTAHASTSTRPTFSPLWFSYSDGLIVQGRATFSDLAVKNTFKKGSGAPQGSNFVQVTRPATAAVGTGVWTTCAYTQISSSDRESQDDGPVFLNNTDFCSNAPGFYVLTTTLNWGGNTSGNRYQRHMSAGGSILAFDVVSAAASQLLTLTSQNFLPGNGYFINSMQQQTAGGPITMSAHSTVSPFSATFCQVG